MIKLREIGTRGTSLGKHESGIAPQSDSKYRMLMEQASDGIHTYDLQGNILDVNLSLCEMLGYSREELLLLNIEIWCRRRIWPVFRFASTI